MRICHIITRLIVGGAQENTVATCAGLKQLGYDVDLVTGPQTGPEGSLYDAVRAAGVPLIVLKELRRNPNPLLDVQAVMALAVAKCSAPTLASDSSPTNSPGTRSAMVASFPSCETTVSFARPV